MKTLKFFRCKHSQNVVVKLVDRDVPIFCCGEKMEELVANTVEASTEKHVPVVSVNGGIATVEVGSVAHPMEEAHYINFISLETTSNCTIVSLRPSTAPKAEIFVGNEKIIAAYEYCNLHGLWKTEF